VPRPPRTKAPFDASEFRVPPDCPAILSPMQLASLLRVSRSTMYAWIAAGRFDGAYRKRGKHIRFLRDRALELFFNGPDWPNRSCDV
jgi:excisionase family DNA binding protein